jgi:hypothetical protein
VEAELGDYGEIKGTKVLCLADVDGDAQYSAQIWKLERTSSAAVVDLQRVWNPTL